MIKINKKMINKKENKNIYVKKVFYFFAFYISCISN